ncbi:ArsR/SmtB family transcription factor [Actinomycetospora chiangmaiensis]|uniref:ArsR/SmtB family transcription factor n=1 Tax=Actinomycetospora chiangmaiensis TaxID=402650 RepID=UPI000362FEBB|nr:metalloregulator ArsR/SmtB family transcription factor [Actinomycetospora chiangmaiensis]
MIEALGEPMRVTLLERLLDEPATATDLARGLPVTRSAVSQHLQVMKAVGLVSDVPIGTRRVYAVDPDALALLRSYFDAFWSRSLDAFRHAAEAGAPGPATTRRPDVADHHREDS